MNSNVEAIFREMPFLEECIQRERVMSARVERVDEALLNRSAARKDEYVEPFLPPKSILAEHLLLLDARGDCVARVGRRVVRGRFLWWNVTRTVDEPRQTVLESLQAAPRPVHYIVSFHERNLVVHKCPRNFADVMAWREELVRRAQVAFKAQIATIDAEGVEEPAHRT